MPPIEVNDPESYQDEPLWSDTHTLLNILKINTSKDSVPICYGDGKGDLDFGDAFLAAQKTLQLIKHAHDNKNTLDSYLLLSRLFESLLEYLFFIALRQDYAEKLFPENTNLNKQDLDALNRLMLKDFKADDASTIEQYLEKLDLLNPHVKECKEKYLRGQLKDLLKVLSDHTQKNALYKMSLTFLSNEETPVDIKKDLSLVISIILVFVTLLKPQLLNLRGYQEGKDSSQSPSQYSVAIPVRHYLDNYISVIDPQLVQYLNDNNPLGVENQT